MRASFFLLTILLVTPTLAFSQYESPSATQSNDRQTMQQQGNGTSTLTGCLTGKPDEYQLVDQRGTTHLIFNPGVDLSSYVGHSIEVMGKRDVQRDASASSDEGTAHGMHFFKVVSVNKDLGRCK
jgi:hypothetical protein